MNKAKHRLLTPVERAEQRKAQLVAAAAKMAEAQKRRAEKTTKPA